MKKIFSRFDLWISATLLCGIATLMFYEVVMRYVFHNSSAVLTEICSLSFIWFIYFSMSHITGERDHITIQLADIIFPKGLLKYIQVISDLIMLAFMSLMAINGVRLVLSIIEFPFVTPVMNILMFWPYSVIPLAFGVQAVKMLQLLYADVKIIVLPGSGSNTKENGYA